MKQIVVYDGSTGKILSVLKKSVDDVVVATGTGILTGSHLGSIQVTSGNAGLVAQGEKIAVLYGAKKQLPSRRIKKDELGNPVLGPMGFPVAEEYFVDMEWNDFIDGLIVSVNQGVVEIDRIVSDASSSSASFSIIRQVPAVGYTEDEVEKVIADLSVSGASALRIDSEVDVNPKDWKVDLVTHRLVKIDQITYE